MQVHVLYTTISHESLNNFNKTDMEDSLAAAEYLILAVQVAPWFKYVVAQASTSMLGHQSPSFCFLLERIFTVCDF